MTEFNIHQEQLDKVSFWKSKAKSRERPQEINLEVTINYGYWLNNKTIASVKIDLDVLGIWYYTDLGWFRENHIR